VPIKESLCSNWIKSRVKMLPHRFHCFQLSLSLCRAAPSSTVFRFENSASGANSTSSSTPHRRHLSFDSSSRLDISTSCRRPSHPHTFLSRRRWRRRRWLRPSRGLRLLRWRRFTDVAISPLALIASSADAEFLLWRRTRGPKTDWLSDVLANTPGVTNVILSVLIVIAAMLEVYCASVVKLGRIRFVQTGLGFYSKTGLGVLVQNVVNGLVLTRSPWQRE